MDSLEIALKMETDAISFYTEAAKRTTHPVGKKMFRAVAGDEKRHLRMISRAVKGLRIPREDLRPLKSSKTVFESFKGEMTGKVETKPDDLEAFTIAMKMEKEGVEYYSKILSGAKADKEKELLKLLIGEEQEHYRLFADTHQFLSDTANWFMWEERSIVEGG